ncbi:hypothetical protein SEA_RAYMOND7_60 [Mycobacterium phage Raymond7]|uniref:Uncharacterized protein n=6 Tax=Charlievirus TaxID=1623280 RepID=A0AA48V657_9CAUD|nr:hypothetical protein CL59_gp66 [Mycobacterium phage Redi]YP_010051861.1 hypothetical protein KD927_gp60 [Mycobacterium phage Raymond7]QAY16049.1 hypothetical protein SEA_BABERUTH_67 [Mycobacterium phage BabeRuth]QBI99197.1 hypothetical protein SEA_NENAE_67 [Mycobacterium phage Nenae]QBI99268.1 hypothetical protein SEA_PURGAMENSTRIS_67 [Mycobacterium phage Purgamenstris]QBI99950.1 hypothetical protein SEA_SHRIMPFRIEDEGG_67 [Mycobacterium phage ShrimpFriedEgg]AEN79931.1 hypothetical protein 
MPVKHLRVCAHCNKIRYADCSIGCRAPAAIDPQSWQRNLQHGAGTITPPLCGPTWCGCGNCTPTGPTTYSSETP